MGASTRTPSFWVPVVKFQLQREGVFNTGTLKLLPRFLLLRATCSVFCPRRRSVDRFPRFLRQGQVLKVSKIRRCDSVSCSDIMGLHRNIVAHAVNTSEAHECFLSDGPLASLTATGCYSRLVARGCIAFCPLAHNVENVDHCKSWHAQV